MNHRRAVRMHSDNANSLGRLRLQSGIEVTEHGDTLWLHIAHSSEELDAALRTLPGERFTVLPDDQLVPLGNRVPTGHLPDCDWIELSRWLRVTAPLAGFSGQLPHKIELQFTRGGPTGESNLIVTDVATWHDYAISAPQVRLERWSFAMNGAGQVLVRGTPLPPIAGTRFVEASGVAIAAGWTWTPHVAPEVLAEVLELEKGDLALLHSDGQWDLIPSDSFVRATRSAVRLSAEEVAHD